MRRPKITYPARMSSTPYPAPLRTLRILLIVLGIAQLVTSLVGLLLIWLSLLWFSGATWWIALITLLVIACGVVSFVAIRPLGAGSARMRRLVTMTSLLTVLPAVYAVSAMLGTGGAYAPVGVVGAIAAVIGIIVVVRLWAAAPVRAFFDSATGAVSPR